MALIVTFLGYEDFRHQLVTKLDSLQPLLAELTVFVQTGNDAVRAASLIKEREWGALERK